MTRFLSKIQLQEKKDGSFMIMSIAKGRGMTRMNPHCHPKVKKGYAECMVVPPRYYSFCVFKSQQDTQCRVIFKTAVLCARKSSKKMPWTNQYKKRCASR